MEDDHNSNIEQMSSYELVKYYFEQNGFTNENEEDLKMVAELHERWLKKDHSELSKPLFILSQDPDVQEVLRLCRQSDSPKRRMTKADLQVLLEKMARGEVERKDYVGKDAECVWLTPNFNERLTAIKMLMGDADNEGSERVYFIDDIEAKYLEQQENANKGGDET